MNVIFDFSSLHGNGLIFCFLSFASIAIIWAYAHLLVQRKHYHEVRTSSHEHYTHGAKLLSAGSAPYYTYASVFPPSQCVTAFAHVDVTDLVSSQANILEIEKSYRSASLKTYIFSGFKVEDVLKLGDFPNYAKLSGVPLPTPLPDFCIEKAAPRPYRPLRWNYHQTMASKKMSPDFWIELESTYQERMRQRQDICTEHGEDVLQALPGSELACKELMEMVVQFLCARYPKQFEIVGTSFVNHILGTTHDLNTREPLHILRDNVPEDFAITLRDEKTGHYVFRAGIICSSIGWNLGRKIGLDLNSIHAPVPDYKEKMELSMNRFFSKMPTSSPIQRGSWGLSKGQPIFQPGSLDSASLKYRNSYDPSLRIEDVFLRTDWQTLRRLPLSGAIVFNFKVLFTPITELRDEPYIPSLMLKILNEGKKNLMDHKGTKHVEHVAKPVLKEYEFYQIECGIIEQDWKPQTLDESPFFPGWERKWSTG